MPGLSKAKEYRHKLGSYVAKKIDWYSPNVKRSLK